MHFVHESIIRAQPSAVFAFHERPDALQKLVPPWEEVEVVQPPASLHPGTRVVLRMGMGPFKLTWEAEHTKYEKNVLFQDRLVRGPFKKWLHTHRTLPIRAASRCCATRSSTSCRCSSCRGLPIVLRRLRRMFEYRHQVTAAEVA